MLWTCLRRNRVALELVGQLAGVRQTGEDVFSSQPGVVGEDLIFRLPGCQQFQNELDGETGPADHRLAGQDLGIDHNAFRQRQTLSLQCQREVRSRRLRGLARPVLLGHPTRPTKPVQGKRLFASRQIAAAPTAGRANEHPAAYIVFDS